MFIPSGFKFILVLVMVWCCVFVIQFSCGVAMQFLYEKFNINLIRKKQCVQYHLHKLVHC
jgi:hypothetical protein